MKEIITEPNLVAYCGLYCGACKAYLKGRCPGCSENLKATWCKVRSCCIHEGFANCADCKQYPNPDDCKYFNNIMAKLFAFLFRSNRGACIQQIREIGIDRHAENMAQHKRQTIRK